MEGGKTEKKGDKKKRKRKGAGGGGKREESRKHTALTGEASSARELRALARSLYDPVRWA